jgi:hypothetical protein
MIESPQTTDRDPDMIGRLDAWIWWVRSGRNFYMYGCRFVRTKPGVRVHG